MADIIVVKSPTAQQLQQLGVKQWPIWEKEISSFPWTYDAKEVCYLIEGEVTVTPKNGASVSFGKGDLVTFPAGMSCTWTISKSVRKHYHFE